MNYYTKHYSENQLSKDLINEGTHFIHSRFNDEWGIYRYDVDFDRVLSRENTVMFDGKEIIGWLGLEESGELTNACISKNLNGVDLLRLLIQKSLSNTNLKYYFAEVPILKTGSARTFLMSGFRLCDPLCLTQIIYPEKPVSLVRLELHSDNKQKAIVDEKYVEKNIKKIKEVENCG